MGIELFAFAFRVAPSHAHSERQNSTIPFCRRHQHHPSSISHHLTTHGCAIHLHLMQTKLQYFSAQFSQTYIRLNLCHLCFVKSYIATMCPMYWTIDIVTRDLLDIITSGSDIITNNDSIGASILSLLCL